MINLIYLFFIAAISATLFPLNSEIALRSFLALKVHHPIILLLVATAGNSLGATLNWYLGRHALHYQNKSWFPFKPRSLLHAQSWFNRHGKWVLLLSWLPIIGDALTFIAGTLKVKFICFIILCSIGKAARYSFIVLAFYAFF